MKKILLSCAAAFVILGSVSCTKEYTCSCTFADSSKNFDVILEKMRKNDAKTVCYDYSVFVGNCQLK